MSDLRGMSDQEIDAINAEARRAYNEGTLCMLLSEPVLTREWLTPEEDEAWKHLSEPLKGAN